MSVNSNGRGRLNGIVNRVLGGHTDRSPTSIQISDTEVESLTPNRTGDLSEIADIRVPKDYVYVFPPDRPIQMYLPVHEHFTASGNADETFALSNDLAESAWMRQTTSGAGNGIASNSGRENLMVFQNGSQVAPNTVDYDANEFTLDGPSADDDIDVYYAWQDGGEVHIRSRQANLEGYKQRLGHTVAGFHNPNVYDKDEMVPWKNSFALDEKERLEVLVDSDVDLDGWQHYGGGGNNGSRSFAYFQLPCYKIPKSSI